MTHPIHRVARFDIVGPYTLSVAFVDGTAQEIDFRPVLHGALFGPLRDLAMFNAVTLDQVKAAARRLLLAEPAILVIGPEAADGG